MSRFTAQYADNVPLTDAHLNTVTPVITVASAGDTGYTAAPPESEVLAVVRFSLNYAPDSTATTFAVNLLDADGQYVCKPGGSFAIWQFDLDLPVDYLTHLEAAGPLAVTGQANPIDQFLAGTFYDTGYRRAGSHAAVTSGHTGNQRYTIVVSEQSATTGGSVYAIVAETD